VLPVTDSGLSEDAPRQRTPTKIKNRNSEPSPYVAGVFGFAPQLGHAAAVELT
jgi:hypothetical protein